MAGYLPYPEYKESGVEWLGKIPHEWTVMALHYAAILKSGESITTAGMDDIGDYPVYGGNGFRGYTFDYTHEGEFALIGRQGALCGNINYAVGKFWASEHAIVVNPTRKLVVRYIGELLRAMNLNQYSVSAAQPGLSAEQIGRLKIPFPSISEQQTIARFLDHKTAQIDALIAKKQTLLEKLAEKRTALISHAVTKGLDPNVKMKDSGVEWLGEVPAHWAVISLRFACEFLNRKRIPLSSEERGSMTDRAYPYYGASGIIDYVEDYIFGQKTILIAEDGANLLSRSTPLAFIADGKYWVNNHAHILNPIKGPFEYWSNLLCTIQYEPWITGAAQPKLTKENLGGIQLPLPPEDEQHNIAKYIADHVGDIDPMIQKVTIAIEKLKEYRSALITQAVTGKIDVRNVKIPDANAKGQAT